MNDSDKRIEGVPSARSARPFTLFHSRLDGKVFLECVIHGAQTGTLSQADAEARHGKEQCPRCLSNIEATGDRSKAVPNERS